jgi:hypothetical protein
MGINFMIRGLGFGYRCKVHDSRFGVYGIGGSGSGSGFRVNVRFARTSRVSDDLSR